MTTALATAADERYGYLLLNMLGSVHRNSRLFDRIVVYDLGLNARQRELVEGVRGVEVRGVPPFVPHWAQGFTWKPWIWTHTEADHVLYLDAGLSVLRSLREPLDQIARRGYFVISQGHTLRDIVPSDYVGLYGLSEPLLQRHTIAAGIIGFATRGAFYDDVIVPTLEDAVLGRSLGYSRDELKLNHGLGQMEDVVVRDCRIFRHDQTLLNIHFYKQVEAPFVNEPVRYEWTSPHEHPEQLIWHHRRRGDFRFLRRVPYGPGARLRGWAFTVRFRSRWLLRQHGWKLRPARYLSKLARIAGRA